LIEGEFEGGEPYEWEDEGRRRRGIGRPLECHRIVPDTDDMYFGCRWMAELPPSRHEPAAGYRVSGDWKLEVVIGGEGAVRWRREARVGLSGGPPRCCR